MTLENGPVSLYVRTNYRKLGWNEAVRMTSLGTALMIWPLLKLGPSHRDESLSYFPADLREQVVDESTLEPDLLAELRTVETDLQALGFERVACSTDRQSVVKGVNAVAAMHLRHPSRHLVAFVGCARKTAGGFQTYTSVGAWDAGAVFYGITNQPPMDGPPQRKVRWLRAATAIEVLDAMDRQLPYHRRQPFAEEEMWEQLAVAQWAQVSWRLSRGRFDRVPGPQTPQSHTALV
ncbi:hypothetical protein GCM10008955_00150 [Deinococcus malanensis]|uniref:Uncharacterized protein n=1 Tax=Deinococcus malanensis TaxID=1706855 RepID=A0ABQ2EFT5_9DEIO|nr:hypothetical protein [Deinococcus malanensis]GGK10897.1 hypothetical protein GCM10008955_00150 [Deinococcus malanensis]